MMIKYLEDTLIDLGFYVTKESIHFYAKWILFESSGLL